MILLLTFFLAPTKTEISNLDKACSYLLYVAYDSDLQLCCESPNVNPNYYWLVSDNLLAWYSLGKEEIKQKLIEYAKKYDLPRTKENIPISYKHEAIIGKPIKIPFNESQVFTLETIDRKEVRTEILNSTTQITDWESYADLLLYASLHYQNLGESAKVKEYFEKAKALWDGIGLRDKVYNMTGLYETYKLALLLIVKNRAGLTIEFEDRLCEIIWRMQDPRTGGIYTHYSPNLDKLGDTNTETTSYVIIAQPREPRAEPARAYIQMILLAVFIGFVCLLVLRILTRSQP